MIWKSLRLCAIFFGLVLTAQASDPMTYKEIALLVRNGEQQQFIIADTARRKLLRSLSPQEEADLVSLGATPGLLNALRASAMIAGPQTAADYKARMLQQQRQEQSGAIQAATPPFKKPPVNEPVEKPLNLKFTAVDGSSVDLTSLRGKVVLIDFWATWCGPCMHEIPNVVAAYKKYHGKGFEIVGISLDKRKDAMLRVTQEKEMTWPQYFDGKGWDNEISSSFHIDSIPSMWLVNKKGIVVTTDARENLDTEVAKLLAE